MHNEEMEEVAMPQTDDILKVAKESLYVNAVGMQIRSSDARALQQEQPTNQVSRLLRFLAILRNRLKKSTNHANT